MSQADGHSSWWLMNLAGPGIKMMMVTKGAVLPPITTLVTKKRHAREQENVTGYVSAGSRTLH